MVLKKHASEVSSSEMSYRVLFSRVLRVYVRPFLFIFIVGIAMNAISSAASGFLPILIEKVIDKAFVGRSEFYLKLLPLLIVITIFTRGLSKYFGTISMSYVAQKFFSSLQSELFKKIIFSDLELFQNYPSGYFMSFFSNDLNKLKDIILSSFINFTQNVLTVAALLLALFFINLKLAFLGVGFVPFMFLFASKFSRKTKKASEKNFSGYDNFYALFSETTSGMRTIKAYAREDYEMHKANSAICDIFRSTMRVIKMRIMTNPINETLSGFGLAAVIYVSGSEIANHQLTLGEFSSFLGALVMSYQPIKSIVFQNNIFQEGIVAARRVFSLIDRDNDVNDVKNAQDLHITHAHICFQHVSFFYQSHAEKQILCDISFELPQGKIVALVGPSGGGKSTVLNLLLRFFDPSEGNIFIDGQDVRFVAQHSLRKSIALVTQDPFLFNDTLEENIRYGELNATSEDIQHAAKMAVAHDFIMQKKDGYRTRVGEGGVQLSGGQKQRIAIARAMLKNAPILLLDEATSSLDVRTEHQVQKSLTNLMRGRTTLMVTHRLSAIMHVDYIYVIDHGHILEHGTHDALMCMSTGLYRNLYFINKNANY